MPVPDVLSCRSPREAGDPADALPNAEAWYAVWTHSHYEYLVAQQLSSKGFKPLLPEMSVWSKRVGGKRLVKVPMFPGYLFLRHGMEKRSYIEILKVRGIGGILEDGWTRLTPIPNAEVDAIQRIMEADVPILPHAHLRHGDRVRVNEGPLAGLEGLFVQSQPNKGRLVVSVELLGRSVAVEIDGTGVTACESRVTH